MKKIAFIVWQDASQSKPGWVSPSEANTKLVKYPSIITSAGIYVGRQGGRHIISTGVSDDGEMLGFTAIPIKLVKRIQFIPIKESK